MGGPIGSAAGTLLPGLFRAGMDAFGLSDTSSSTQDAQRQGANALAQAQQIASYTQSGQEGAFANREAFQKSRELVNTNSAESLLNQGMLRNIGSQALGNAQNQVDIASTLAQRNLGSQRQGLMQMAGRAGASPAALAAIAGQVGNGATQALLGLQQQGAQATAQGLGQAGQLFGQADQARIGDLQNRLQLFQPFALQKFGGSNLGNLSGLGGMAESVSTVNAAEDPFDLLKGLAGQVSGVNFGNLNLDQRYGPAAQNAWGYPQQRGYTPYFGPGF
jgi:hypothetical protein